MASLSDYKLAMDRFLTTKFKTWADLDAAYKNLDSILRSVQPDSDKVTAASMNQQANEYHLREADRLNK